MTLTVSDGSSVLPGQRDDDDGESGRDLMIIEALAEDWGVVDARDGKTVWVTMTRPEPQA